MECGCSVAVSFIPSFFSLFSRLFWVFSFQVLSSIFFLFLPLSSKIPRFFLLSFYFVSIVCFLPSFYLFSFGFFFSCPELQVGLNRPGKGMYMIKFVERGRLNKIKGQN